VKAQAQKFWFGENPGKIPENLCEVSRNNGQKWRAAGSALWDMAPEITWRPFLWGQLNNLYLWENVRTKSGPKFFGQKSFAPPNICLLLHLWLYQLPRCWPICFHEVNVQAQYHVFKGQCPHLASVAHRSHLNSSIAEELKRRSHVNLQLVFHACDAQQLHVTLQRLDDGSNFAWSVDDAELGLRVAHLESYGYTENWLNNSPTNESQKFT